MTESDRRTVVAGDLVEKIRAEVRLRHERGAYPVQIASELEAVYADVPPKRRFHGELAALNGAAFSADVDAASRKRVVGPLVAGAKRSVRGGLRWYANGLLQQVAVLARLTSSAISSLGARVDAVERDVNERLEDAFEQTHDVRRRAISEFDALRMRVARLEATVAELSGTERPSSSRAR